MALPARAQATTATDRLVHLQPRAQGFLRLTSKKRTERSVINEFRCAGSFKGLFPRSNGPLQLALINTSGGLTGGDTFAAELEAGAHSRLEVTSQAAERAYRSQSGAARVSTDLRVGSGARLDWLPQELILFDGCNLERNLQARLALDAEFLLVEPVVFGRQAMRERLWDAVFVDRIEVWRDQEPLYLDAIQLRGDLTELLASAAVGQRSGAMATVVFASPRAEPLYYKILSLLPERGGASLLRQDLLVLRLLAEDSFVMRQSLVPILETLKDGVLPRAWSI